GGHDSRQVRDAGRQYVEVHAEEGREDRPQGAGLGDRQCLQQFQCRCRRFEGDAYRSRSRADAQAVPCTRQGPRRANRQAQQSHPGSSVRREARGLMGQKANPIGIRLGITRDWTSKWYAGSKTFASNIHTDFLVRKYLNKKLADPTVSGIHTKRAAARANITIHTARPGIVIGKKGEDIEKLRGAVAKILGM